MAPAAAADWSEGAEPEAFAGVGIGNRNAVPLGVEHGQHIHRDLFAVGDDAFTEQVGHGHLPLTTVDAAPGRANGDVIPRGGPASLLGDFDPGHAVLGKEPLFLGDDQRDGFYDGQIAQLNRGGFGGIPGGYGAGGDRRSGGCCCGRHLRGGIPQAALEEH